MTRVLRQRFAMHARLKGGSLYAYAILDGAKVIGSLERRRKGKVITVHYFLGTDDDAPEWDTADQFKRAYEQQLKEQNDGNQ